jgi:isopentenyl phosphate kinase
VKGLHFLKLGGSLITDKATPGTARLDVLSRLAEEIAAARAEAPELRLLLGHGSGSFGHVAADKYGTRDGVSTPEGWLGFAEVWRQASALNRLVIESLHAAGLPALSFPASAGAFSEDGQIKSWDVTPIQAALDRGLLPVVYGDVAFDSIRGGTILSTEDLFIYLAPHLEPSRILLAGIEGGVWADYHACTRLVESLTPANLAEFAPALAGSIATDVTGGMETKVRQMLSLVERLPNLEVLIFSGQGDGVVKKAILGGTPGTRIAAVA